MPIYRSTGRTCIVHIGMHKTGSSSIQRTINANLGVLEEKFGVASFGQRPNHSVFAPGLINDPDEIEALPVLGQDTPESRIQFSRDQLALLEDEFRALKTSRFVISGEGLSRMKGRGIPRLHALLNRYFDDVHIVIYVREPFSYANSAAAQLIKGGATFESIRTRTLVDGARQDDTEGKVARQDRGNVLPNYRKRIEGHWLLTGPDKLHCIRFDRPSLRNGDVVDDFFWRFLGIDIADLPVIRREENVGLDAGPTFALEYLNRVEPPFIDERLNLKRTTPLVSKLQAGRSNGTKFAIPGFDYARFAEITRPDVEWLRDLTGGAIDFSLRVPEMPPPPTPDELLSAMELLNHQSLERDWMAQRTLVFRELWRHSMGQALDTGMLENIVAISTDVTFLPNLAHNFRLANLPDLARQAEERAALLRERLA